MKKFCAIIIALILLFASSALAERMVCIIKDTQYVRVRAMPKKESSEVGRLHYGDAIDVEGIDNGFFKIRYNDETAYVAIEFFEIEVPNEKYVVTANGRVAKRAKPNGTKKGWLNPGVKIEVLGWRYDLDGKKWARVYGNYYVSAAYLTAAE